MGIDKNKFLRLAMAMWLAPAACGGGQKTQTARPLPSNEMPSNDGTATAPAPTDECVDWDPSGECIEWAQMGAPMDECVDWDPSGECIQWDTGAPVDECVQWDPSGECIGWQ